MKGKHPADLGLGHQTNFKIPGEQTSAQNNIFGMEIPYTVLLCGHFTGVINQDSSVVQWVQKEKRRRQKPTVVK